MHSRLITGTLIVIGWQLIAPALVHADDSLLQTGQRYFNQHDYPRAEEFFRVASQSEPPSAEAHYWYATTLAKRFRGSDAVIEYERCLALHPSPVLTRYCRAALSGYGVAAEDGAPAKPDLRPSNLVQDRRAQDAASAAARIQDQASAEGTRLHNIGQTRATARQQEGDMFAAQDLAKGQAVTRSMKGVGRSAPSQAQLDQVQEHYKELADREQRMAHDSAAAIDHEYQDRQNALSDAAASLQQQLSAPPTSHTSTLLQPLGTNIYVRNYEPIGPLNDDDDDVIISPMRAHAEKLKPEQNQP